MKYLFTLTCLFSISLFGQKNYPQIEGWKISNETTYNSDSLWILIDGAAEAFLRYDFSEMRRVEYSQNNNYIEVQVYHYKDNENAFGIYSQERPSKGHYIEMGVQGYQDKGTLNFLAGPDYIKMHSNAEDDTTGKIMFQIANELAKKTDPSPAFPATLKLFPAENKVPNSEQLISKDFLGYSFFTNVYQASYDEKGNGCFMFILNCNSEADAKQLVQKYCDAIKSKCDFSDLKIKDPNNGFVYLAIKGNLLMGVYNAKKKNFAHQLLK